MRKRLRQTLFKTLSSIFLALTLCLSALAGPEGEWRGAIQLPGQALKITVKLRQDGGTWLGSVDIPQQNARDLPLEQIEVNGHRVRFRIQGVPGSPRFEGELFLDETELSGQFSQGGQSFPFKLQRPHSPEALAEAAQQAEQEQARLQALSRWIETQMKRSQTPGMAVAIVKDDRVIFKRGFGLRDRESQAPVTTQTRFAIGSSTKAMTAMLLGMLVDEQRLRWEQPVRDLLPDFRLHDRAATEAITVRDLLNHTSGLPRHDLLWYGVPLTREQLYQRLRHVEPSATLRERFQYNNLMYMVAGQLAAQVAGRSWESLLEQRLFAPLKMHNASPSGAVARRESQDHATAYARRKTGLQKVPYRSAVAIGPAGSVHASLEDMLQWLRLHLNGGEVDGKRLISRRILAELHSPQVVMAPQEQVPTSPYMLYGSGWMIYPYRGHHLLQHGGNIDGFTAQVALLPEQRLGLVVLSNLDKDPLPALTMNSILDRFLGLEAMPWEAQLDQWDEMRRLLGELRADERAQVQGTRPSHALEAYAGSYGNQAYQDLRVTKQGQDLRLRYGALQGRLKHFHYDTFLFEGDTGDFDGMLLQFETDLAGQISRLRIQLEPQLPAFVLQRTAPPEWQSAEYLKAFAGSYQIGPQKLEIIWRHGLLMAHVMGQASQRLLPTARDRFRLEGTDARLYFEREQGRIVSGLLIQPGGSFKLKRLN